MDPRSKRSPSMVKPALKGVIGAGVLTVVFSGALGISMAALPAAAAGAIYANYKAKPKSVGQKAKVWGVVAGAGVAVAALMQTAEMIPTLATLGFTIGTVAPLIGNQILNRLSGRRQASGVIETRPTVQQGHNGRQVAGGEPTITDRQPSQPLSAGQAEVSIAVPAAMADRVAQFVESLKGPQQQAPQEEAPRRTPYRPT